MQTVDASLGSTADVDVDTEWDGIEEDGINHVNEWDNSASRER